MAKFFIDRPVFAWVIAICLMLAGILSILNLPIAQYPNIAPPAISIQVTYPGASAQTVQDSVVQVIEQQMNGIDNLSYITSESNSDGSMTITLTFTQGTDPDTAQVQVQNKLAVAQPLLPQEVQQQGIRVTKATKNFLIFAGFISTDGSMAKEDLANYVAANVQDPISRTQGVGDFQLFGSQYAMRIWLDPAKLLNFSLTTSDVVNAIEEQNVQVSSGSLGGLPSVRGQQLNATIIGPTRLQTAEEFGEILLKVNSNGSQVRLRDVATVSLGAQSYSIDSYYNGTPATGLGIKLAPGANALDTVEAVRHTINTLKPYFPPGMEVVYPYDTSPFVSLSIESVIHTLIEAIILVFLVMYLFLQNFRATLIPTLAVPVVLLGTFAVLAMFGYSINTLTMFGMVLAIGLLVDDAIVVVENVERLMAEEGLSPKQATRKSMSQITGALVGIALVLSAVFVPMAFFGGSTGVIYRQFSITIVAAMTLSVLVAIVFTPALCATMLKRIPKGHHGAKTGFFGWFNRMFDRSTTGYANSVARGLGRTKRLMLIYLLLVLIMGWLFTRIPTSFLPEEDQGILFVQVQAPTGSTAERTSETVREATRYLLEDEKDVVTSVFAVHGFSFGGRGQNSAIMFVKLRDWADRPNAEQKVGALAQRANAFFATHLHDARVAAFAPPAVMELGNASGFDFQLMDQAGLGHEKLAEARDKFLAEAAKSPILVGTRLNGMVDQPQYQLNIDREKARALGVAVSDINSTLSTAWGSSYVNDFLDRGRVKRVYVQGQADSRMLPEDLKKWYVRNSSGEMVPFSSFSSAEWVFGPPRLDRFNGVASFNIQGNPAPGYSSGEAMAEMERIASTMPTGVGYQWTGLSFEERLSGSQAPALYAISLLVVFLCLAALYESWAIPTSVMLAVPLGVIGVLVATLLRGLSNDVYFQVGLLTTVGLSAKNAILIVEFAKAHYEEGASLVEAAVHAARQRLRPILMTSLAFILGVVPLAISNGAGSGSQHAIGTGVIGGMLAGTFLAIFFVPAFFVVMLRVFKIKRLSERRDDDDDEPQDDNRALPHSASTQPGEQPQ
ncbi:efflux RND transporter permease subunit [Bordetella genomosp. 4]|uniref:efflux RND transporter permease subunit n=1 Tax=Bordetella genomosp. 4 TaxID=463044 RepID=UPI000B9E256E|nr:efflux RND transporter permease subunit [Bordetella genomosp. 4]OZI49471.1 hydrophobe/amphiphile efflux-1 family RND transporter [Bordetella genomosp. 4]